MYRLMATDIDGTLIRNDMSLSERTKNTVRKAVLAGLVIAPCSGRGPGPLKKVSDLFEVPVPLVCYNGAVVIDGKTGEKIYEKPMKKEDAVDVYLKGRKIGMAMEVWTTDNELGYDSWNEFTEFYQLNSTKKREEITLIGDDLSIFEKPIAKVLWHQDPSVITPLIKKSEEYIIREKREMVCATSQDFLLEFTHTDATKAMGIKALSDYYSIPHDETIGIGDGLNDISMIKYAKLGIAMANAHPEVIKAADYIAPSNEEDGVAFVIEKFMMEKNI